MSFLVITNKSMWDEHYGNLINPSVYGSYEYCKASELLEPDGRCELAVSYDKSGNFIAHPYIRRSIKDSEYSDLICPFDYGGFWFSTVKPAEKKNLIEVFNSYFRQYCVEEGIVSEFMRVHPWTLAPNFYDVSLVRDNVVVDIGKSIDQIVDGFASSVKGDLRKSQEAEIVVEKISIQDFMSRSYVETIKKGRSNFYLFSREWARLIDISGNVLCLGAFASDGNLASAHVYVKDGDILLYFLSASNDKYLHCRPNDAILWHVMNTNKEFQFLHLGGGTPESLMKFKQKFSPRRVPYYQASAIFLTDVYDCIPTLGTGFPRYREDR